MGLMLKITFGIQFISIIEFQNWVQVVQVDPGHLTYRFFGGHKAKGHKNKQFIFHYLRHKQFDDK